MLNNKYVNLIYNFYLLIKQKYLLLATLQFDIKKALQIDVENRDTLGAYFVTFVTLHAVFPQQLLFTDELCPIDDSEMF